MASQIGANLPHSGSPTQARAHGNSSETGNIARFGIPNPLWPGVDVTLIASYSKNCPHL